MVCCSYMVGCSVSSRGLRLQGLSRPDVPVPFKPPRRGRITSFSAHSAIRLRETLFSLRGSGDPWAFTFTFPFDMTKSEYYALFKRFHMMLLRRKIGMIWRVELTLRGRPHLHCVCYPENFDRVFEIMTLWWDVVGAWSFVGGVEHSVSCRCIRGSRWWQYVAAHTAKQKKCQLGWKGRQWGVISKSSFVSDVRDFSIDVKSLFRVLRVLRKLSHCRNNQRGLFGSSVWFCSADTSSRLSTWARESEV